MTDPFLSRMPAIRFPNWRIGHHFRKIPTEFGQYKIGKIQNIPDSKLGDMLNDVTIVTRDDLFSLARFEAIWRLLTNSYSNLNFDKYINPKIWIPLSESTELMEIKNWDTKIQLDNKPYWLERVPQRSFNNNLKIVSNKPKMTSIVWVYLNWGYTYDLYVNSDKIYTLDKRNYCPNGLKIFLDRELLIENIEIRATDDLDTSHFGFNFIGFIRLHDSYENETSFEPNCIVTL